VHARLISKSVGRVRRIHVRRIHVRRRIHARRRIYVTSPHM
jgi:hypothetical protein